jgi:hypothetical protein
MGKVTAPPPQVQNYLQLQTVDDNLITKLCKLITRLMLKDMIAYRFGCKQLLRVAEGYKDISPTHAAKTAKPWKDCVAGLFLFFAKLNLVLNGMCRHLSKSAKASLVAKVEKELEFDGCLTSLRKSLSVLTLSVRSGNRNTWSTRADLDRLAMNLENYFPSAGRVHGNQSLLVPAPPKVQQLSNQKKKDSDSEDDEDEDSIEVIPNLSKAAPLQKLIIDNQNDLRTLETKISSFRQQSQANNNQYQPFFHLPNSASKIALRKIKTKLI